MAEPAKKEFPQPPRSTGDTAADIAALLEYTWALYRSMFLEHGGVVQNVDLGGLAGVDAVATDDIQNNAVTTAKIADGAVTFAKLPVVVTNTLLGRATAGDGVVELITCTAAGRAVLDDASFAAMRTTLGLGALATLNTIGTGQLDGDSVTFEKMQELGANTMIANFTAGSANPTEIAVSAGAKSFIVDEIPTLKSYTVAGVPSAVTFDRGLIYVSDETGGAVPAFSDGTNWRRVTDRAIVS